MHLLGRIYEEKEECERARCYRSDLHRESDCLVDECVEITRSGCAATSGFARAPQVVDDVIRLIAFEAPNDIAEPCGEKPNVVVERDVLWPRIRIAGNGFALLSRVQGRLR
jgi:hypothetical protein